jgi:hypothetical protein
MLPWIIAGFRFLASRLKSGLLVLACSYPCWTSKDEVGTAFADCNVPSSYSVSTNVELRPKDMVLVMHMIMFSELCDKHNAWSVSNGKGTE